ncbi:MAG: phosphodiester glycosidase family protein [Desulfomonile tiedjei]|nr:phosphodiester glycosidase family protein [Desulfomonile tiedjei]
MTDRIARIWVVPLVVTLFLTAPAFGEQVQGSGERHARLSSGSAEHEQNTNAPEESFLPAWLESVFTRALPDEKTEDLQKQFESTVAVPEPRPAEGNPDPFIQKPPDIRPLYTSPQLEGEGVWRSDGMPQAADGRPLFYKTVYRPSAEFPNSVVHMALFDMNRLKPRFFIGETEPGIYLISHSPGWEDLSKIVAITNAMWMQQHSRGAGAIFRGQVIYPMVPGMATMVIYQDDSVDIVEWSKDIPLNLVKDARQLRHLIVKNGAVVEQIVKNGKVTDAEIGLGGFLVDDSGRSTMSNKFWFLANRTAFGVRDDGNLVFVMGHHVSTKDLARALVLAGCKRAIHGDANKHNIVCNFYFRDQKDKIIQRDKLSPEQLQYTMKRYDQGYAKDFFAFYEK